MLAPAGLAGIANRLTVGRCKPSYCCGTLATAPAGVKYRRSGLAHLFKMMNAHSQSNLARICAQFPIPRRFQFANSYRFACRYRLRGSSGATVRGLENISDKNVTLAPRRANLRCGM